MDRSLPVAVCLGVVVGFGTYALFVPDWLVATGTAATYTGLVYFSLAFDNPLTNAKFRFADRIDRLGYVIGVWGFVVGPVAFLGYYHVPTSGQFPFLVRYTGVLAFLFVASNAQFRTRHATRSDESTDP